MSFHVPHDRRIRAGIYGSDDLCGNSGAFQIPYMRVGGSKVRQVVLNCIASDGAGWEHVSISVNRNRCPYWEEMCYAKGIFWDEDDAVIQIHPPASEYVNCHRFTLHLWRKAGANDFFEAPPSWMVGPKPGEIYVEEKTR